MIPPVRLTTTPRDDSTPGLRTPGPRTGLWIAVEQLEPRLLLSLTDIGGPRYDGAPPVAALQVAEIGPFDVSSAPGTTAVAGASTASAAMTVTEGLITSSNGSATYRIPGGATTLFVALQVLSPQPQGHWSLTVRDGDDRAIGTVTVPPGRSNLAVEIQSPGGGETGPITLTVAVDPGRSGPAAGGYDLGVEVVAAGPASASAAPPDVASVDGLDYLFIGPSQSGGVLEESEQPAHPPAARSPGGVPSATGAISQAPPSGQSDPVYARPTSGGGGGRAVLPGEPPTEEQAELADEGQSDRDGELAQGDAPPDASAPAFSERQLVDTPGGQPGRDASADPHGVLARRWAEEGWLVHRGSPSGPVVFSRFLAAGLLVTNLLLIGGPRLRPSRREWRLVFQRRTST